MHNKNEALSMPILKVKLVSRYLFWPIEVHWAIQRVISAILEVFGNLESHSAPNEGSFCSSVSHSSHYDSTLLRGKIWLAKGAFGHTFLSFLKIHIYFDCFYFDLMLWRYFDQAVLVRSPKSGHSGGTGHFEDYSGYLVIQVEVFAIWRVILTILGLIAYSEGTPNPQ